MLQCNRASANAAMQQFTRDGAMQHAGLSAPGRSREGHSITYRKSRKDLAAGYPRRGGDGASQQGPSLTVMSTYTTRTMLHAHVKRL